MEENKKSFVKEIFTSWSGISGLIVGAILGFVIGLFAVKFFMVY